MTPHGAALSNLLAGRYHRLLEAGEAALRAETRHFLEWLFDDPPVRRITLEMLRRYRTDALHFVELQCELFVRLGTLARDLLAILPHRVSCDGFVCDEPSCQVHLRQLDILLRTPRTLGGDWLRKHGPLVDATPIDDAIRHLRRIDQLHTRMNDPRSHRGDAGRTSGDDLEAFRAALLDVWLRYRVGLHQRAERLRSSSAPSIRELIRWAGLAEIASSEPRAMSAAHGWRLLRQVHLDLQAILASTQELDSLLACFKQRSESTDAGRLIQLAMRPQPDHDESSVLTTELARYLRSHGVQAWSTCQEADATRFACSGQSGGSARPIVIDSVAYAGSGAEEPIRRALRRLHGAMSAMPSRANLSQCFLVLFRLGGAVYAVPPNLEFERFSIGIVLIDLGRGATSRGSAHPVVPLGEDELLDAAAATAGRCPAGGGPPRPSETLLWRKDSAPSARCGRAAGRGPCRIRRKRGSACRSHRGCASAVIDE